MISEKITAMRVPIETAEYIPNLKFVVECVTSIKYSQLTLASYSQIKLRKDQTTHSNTTFAVILIVALQYDPRTALEATTLVSRVSPY